MCFKPAKAIFCLQKHNTIYQNIFKHKPPFISIMSSTLEHLQQAESKAALLFAAIESRGIIKAGFTEKEINDAVLNLAEELLGIKKYWHKRIVRAGKNTLCPYAINPPEVLLQEDEIVFLDFGPILEEWEADYGRTYVLGDDPIKLKLAQDSERLWHMANTYFKTNHGLTGADLYSYCKQLAVEAGWEFGGPIAGHLIGQFPHEKIEGEDKSNYIHPENNIPMNHIGKTGEKRYWIIEIHLVNRDLEIGSFYEQLAGF
jgi:Xaa-Pro aminopeptidase